MSGEYVLVFKTKGQKTEIKITRNMKKSYVPDNFSVIVNFKDYKNLALFFEDLGQLWGAPIDKAIKEYLKNKEEGNWAF